MELKAQYDIFNCYPLASLTHLACMSLDGRRELEDLKNDAVRAE